ncbi:MAG: hypothetical protein R3B46_12825 [Phycisphaerales bacterium]
MSFGWTGSAYTTYNIEVADYHTYFVGETGVWVHNAGTNPCQMAYSTLERIESLEGLQGTAKLERFLDVTSTPGRRAAVDMAMRHVMNEVMREIYWKQSISRMCRRYNNSSR